MGVLPEIAYMDKNQEELICCYGEIIYEIMACCAKTKLKDLSKDYHYDDFGIAYDEDDQEFIDEVLKPAEFFFEHGAEIKRIVGSKYFYQREQAVKTEARNERINSIFHVFSSALQTASTIADSMMNKAALRQEEIEKKYNIRFDRTVNDIRTFHQREFGYDDANGYEDEEIYSDNSESSRVKKGRKLNIDFYNANYNEFPKVFKTKIGVDLTVRSERIDEYSNELGFLFDCCELMNYIPESLIFKYYGEIEDCLMENGEDYLARNKGYLEPV